jgi:hypothetical protein
VGLLLVFYYLFLEREKGEGRGKGLGENTPFSGRRVRMQTAVMIDMHLPTQYSRNHHTIEGGGGEGDEGGKGDREEGEREEGGEGYLGENTPFSRGRVRKQTAAIIIIDIHSLTQ